MQYIIFTCSLTSLSEAGRKLVEIGGFTLSLFSIDYTRKPPTPKGTYGFYRIEILSSLVNSVVLLLLSAYILHDGFGRVLEREIQALL